jgi:hypothetical protein
MHMPVVGETKRSCIMGTNNTAESVAEMIEVLTEALNDAGKHDTGVKAAGTRLRNAMLTITKDAKAIRTKVLDDRKGA